MMASVVANGNRDGQSLVLKGVDPETCLIVFKNHWAQVVKILEKHDPLRSGSTLPPLAAIGLGAGAGGGARFGPVPGDEASAVQNYVEHMLLLLMEEESGQAGAMGPILEFVVVENVMERLFVWSLRRDFTDDMKLEQLRMYQTLVGRALQPLLHHKPVLRPLMMLLSSCSGSAAPAVEAELVLLLHQLCCVLAKEPSILELFFHTSEDQGAANFLIFSLLIPFIHREAAVGQQARDALLLVMALSAENQRVAQHVAQNTYFCPVLATGLSGLYSSLPTKLEVPYEEWHCLHREEWLRMPSLVQFLNSLEFCNAVIQVAHHSIRDQLVGYIYNGFLLPVLAPALHKLTVEEVTATTAYLDLFLRSVTEPALLQTFLSFILLHQHDGVSILDTLVSRINTPFQLGTVSLALFRTLIGLYCEDVMLQLVLKYLIPCNHLMLSQRRVVGERDFYSASAARILALTPSCCSPDRSPPPLRQLHSILFSRRTEPLSGSTESRSSLSEDEGQGDSCTIGSELHLDVSYLHYLLDARLSISRCVGACRVWSAPYDGEDPPPERHQPGVLDGPPPPRPAAQLELEWDDSFDACPVQAELAPLASEPPEHIQEMRRSAILLVRGSYIEESDFQDDAMVYDLIANTDASETQPTSGNAAISHSEEASLGNGLAGTFSASGEEDNGLTSLKADVKGQMNCNGNLQNATSTGDNLLAQYEELIRTLADETGGKLGKADEETRAPAEEEEQMDFTSLPAEPPEPDQARAPFGSVQKQRAGSSRGSYNVPFTGPFISVLLSRLENLLSNPLHVNLLLTGIVAQLAAYPQPLLRSFLLNTHLVLQPTVRSLYQVLATVKNQIEELAARRKEFPQRITAAQHWLLAREASLLTADKCGGGSEQQEGGGIPKSSADVSPEQTEVFGAILFSEFLKELAAIAQEHSVRSHPPLEEEQQEEQEEEQPPSAADTR